MSQKLKTKAVVEAALAVLQGKATIAAYKAELQALCDDYGLDAVEDYEESFDSAIEALFASGDLTEADAEKPEYLERMGSLVRVMVEIAGADEDKGLI